MIFTERTHLDSKVLLVGIICAMLIFTVVTTYESLGVAEVIHIDLVPMR